MNAFLNLVKRSIKLFFKDKGMFLVSLITPIILLVLYATFLANVYKDTIALAVPEAIPMDAAVRESIINGTVAGQLLSSLLAVVPITVAFNSNMRMVQDKMAGINNDMLVTPVSRPVVALSYFCGTLAATLIVCYTAAAIGLVYVAIMGWYMSFADVVLLLIDVFILSLFGTALSSLISWFLSTQGQISAVSAVISAGYGFMCGAYIPLSGCSEWMRNMFMFLPGTYGTALIRRHALSGALSEMIAQGVPEAAVNGLRDGIDCNLYFFGGQVDAPVMYLVIVGSLVLLVGLLVLLNTVRIKRMGNK